MALSPGRDAAVKAVFLVTGSTYLSYALSFLASALMARALGPSQYGRYAYVVWLSGVLITVANHGINTSGIRFVAESLGRGETVVAENIHGWLWRRQRWSLMAVLAVFLVVCLWVKPRDWGTDLPLYVGTVVICVMARATYLFDISVAKGHGIFRVEAYSTTAAAFLYAAAVVIMVVVGASLTDYLLLLIAVAMVLWIYAALALRSSGIVPRYEALTAEVAGALKQHLLWTILLVLAASLSHRSIETFLLNALVGPAEVGFFSIAAALTRGSMDLLTVGLTTVLMPAMGRAFGSGGSPRVHAIFVDAFRYFLFSGLLMAGVGGFWSGPAVSLLYGHEYLPVVPALQVMFIVGGLTLTEAAFGSLLATTGHQSLWARVSVSALLVSATLALLLVPRFGLNGAIASFAGSRLLGFAILAVAVSRTQDISMPTGSIWRLLAAASAAVLLSLPVALLAPGATGDVIAGVAYGAAFVLALVRLRAWNRADVEVALSVVDHAPVLLGPARRWLETLRDRYTL